jgi:acid phosphatase family membrane protein YuiD
MGEMSVILISLAAWFFTQCLKTLIGRMRGLKPKFTDTGGMPSGHATFITSAVTVIGLRDGIDSSVFGLAVVIAAIVIHDAIRLRWAVGQQALRLNALIKAAHGKPEEFVAVWLGHRIREVSVGAFIGVVGSWLLYSWWY